MSSSAARTRRHASKQSTTTQHASDCCSATTYAADIASRSQYLNRQYSVVSIRAVALEPVGFEATFDDGQFVHCELACMLWIDPEFRAAFVAMVDRLTPGPCGDDLPPCYVMKRESGGNITAENPHSSAAGKWQMLISTSNNAARAIGRPDLVGVPASRWSEADQDDAARVLWNSGAGCGHWSAC